MRTWITNVEEKWVFDLTSILRKIEPMETRTVSTIKEKLNEIKRKIIKTSKVKEEMKLAAQIANALHEDADEKKCGSLVKFFRNSPSIVKVLKVMSEE